ncbi:type VI secretion protein VasK, partial [Pseudomonas sp. SAICEU22]|nr:type VI secretion protein VasK [Pseudomonas agronomica]
MQMRSFIVVWAVTSGLLLINAIMGAMVWRYPQWLGIQAGSDHQALWLLGISAMALLSVLFLGVFHFLGNVMGRSAYRTYQTDDGPTVDKVEPHSVNEEASNGLREHLRFQYGPLWRHKVRFLLIVGEPTEITAIAPHLAKKKWLEGQRTVLLWGG